MYCAFSFLNPATLKGELKYSIKTDILLTHAGHVSSRMGGGGEGAIIQPEVGPIISPKQEVGPIISPRPEVGPIIFWLRNFSQMRNLVIFISMVLVPW